MKVTEMRLMRGMELVELCWAMEIFIKGIMRMAKDMERSVLFRQIHIYQGIIYYTYLHVQKRLPLIKQSDFIQLIKQEKNHDFYSFLHQNLYPSFMYQKENRQELR